LYLLQYFFGRLLIFLTISDTIKGKPAYDEVPGFCAPMPPTKTSSENKRVMEKPLKLYPKKELPLPTHGCKAVLLLEIPKLWKILD